MLLANCVRRINKIEIATCVNKSLNSFSCRHGGVASHSVHSLHRESGTLPNVTSTKQTVFTKSHYQNNGQLCIQHRYYSSSHNDKDRKYDSDDEDLENWQRKLPRFDNFYHTTPSVYLMLKNALSTLLIRSYFDQQFNRDEFLSGAKQAVEVRKLENTHRTYINSFIDCFFNLCHFCP